MVRTVCAGPKSCDLHTVSQKEKPDAARRRGEACRQTGSQEGGGGTSGQGGLVDSKMKKKRRFARNAIKEKLEQTVDLSRWTGHRFFLMDGTDHGSVILPFPVLDPGLIAWAVPTCTLYTQAGLPGNGPQ